MWGRDKNFQVSMMYELSIAKTNFHLLRFFVVHPLYYIIYTHQPIPASPPSGYFHKKPHSQNFWMAKNNKNKIALTKIIWEPISAPAILPQPNQQPKTNKNNFCLGGIIICKKTTTTQPPPRPPHHRCDYN